MVCSRFLLAALAIALLPCAAPAAERPSIAGSWILNAERTAEVQPDGPRQRNLLGGMPRANVSVGGVPIPTTGESLPTPIGSAKDPRVLHTGSLTIEPGDDALTLVYASGEREVLERGNDQGLISRWNRRKLTSQYETTSRKVSQAYELQRDGSLLVTVKLNPNRGPTVIHKRVFDRAATSTTAAP